MDYTLRKKEVMFMMTEKMITLNNGVEMPIIGFGVFEIPAEHTAQCVYDAIECGYRL